MMLDEKETDRIIALIKRQVVPAIGCTEPIAVALCVAKATEILEGVPEKIDVLLSANILKNAMGVGIPGTGMIGLPIAIALGALIGKSEYQLEVLRDCTPESVELGKAYIAQKRIHISLKENIEEKLYVEVNCSKDGDRTLAIIANAHTNFVYVSRNDRVLLDKRGQSTDNKEESEPELSMRKVYDFSMDTPIDKISFILESKRLNESAAKQALKGKYGHELGKTMSRPLGRGIMGESIFSHILSTTSCACDARMAGAMIPVMSNSGSGNQGICATLPVVVFAEENHNTEEELIRGLTLSHLTAIYIKQSLGALSALCGCVVASTGSSCGITYLMGGTYTQVVYSVKNMIANLTGMICDGAKPSCALKLTSGVSTAILSAMLAVQQECVSSVEGIIDEDVDRSIHNLTAIGSKGMDATDRMVLDIMIHK
jgi:L-cysteine desulfidase